eukprot:14842223-Heterocapsa_arctica.AAC.1
MLDAPAAPRSAAQTRLRSTEQDIDDQPDEKKIKGQQPTQRTQARPAPPMRMEDTMDRPNDPGG